MIDRRQLIIGAAVAAGAAALPNITPATPCEFFASQWLPTRCFAIGDQVGYVAVDSFLGPGMRFFTTAVTSVRAAGGGWVFDFESVGKPDCIDLSGETPPDEYTIESLRHLWHLTKLGPKR